MKRILLLILFLYSIVCKANHRINIYHEKTGNSISIFADSDEFCPISININFITVNLDVMGGNNAIYVIKPSKKKQLLVKLKISKRRKPYHFYYNYKTNYGNYYLDSHDKDFLYNLPFSKSKSFRVLQGYDGDFSHQNINALDFSMPIGTELNAIREGIVVKVTDNNDKVCGKKECSKYNNIIIIYHKDGTFAEYSHIKKDGAIVEAGEKVLQGQKIGYSGNVGFSTGPHLHLAIYKQKLEERVTIKTKFKTGNGTIKEFLSENKTYSRNY